MGTVVVVAVQPIGCHVAHFLQRIEHVAVQHIGAVGLVESFDIGVLSRFARLDVLQSNAFRLCLLDQYIGNELRPVVQANQQRRTAYLH